MSEPAPELPPDGGLVDLHSHLVPDVDDGAGTVEDTLRSVARMRKAGIGTVVTTPHLDASLVRDPDGFRLRMERVGGAFAEAREAVAERFPGVRFLRGHEVMLDVPDPDLSDERLRLAGTSFVLVEWPRLHLPPGTVEVLSRLRMGGVRPVVAHPERYIGGQGAIFAEWRDAGAYLQVNYGSVVGRYGAEPRDRAVRLLQRGWVDYLSTDFHGRPHLKLYKREAWERLESVGGEEQLAMLCGTNPRRLLDDEEPLPVPALPVERGFWSRLRRVFHREEA